MLDTLNFLITVDADRLIACSFRATFVMLGSGRTPRLQTSATSISSRALSLRDGTRTGVLDFFVVNNDCERSSPAPAQAGLLDLAAHVFLSMK
ncbi:hypothetical protein FAUST_4092 [Fusarium austroamericanum]|uniref:Uncharacterized protein n=1 Tax=Fusarium austroamericanum TaxID=282268 RepID=A0AAN6C3T6_FUSAU|nr:hypothetical protein FAUST_4092 [Fusarium austroamericanum]